VFTGTDCETVMLCAYFLIAGCFSGSSAYNPIPVPAMHIRIESIRWPQQPHRTDTVDSAFDTGARFEETNSLLNGLGSSGVVRGR
jgi:hypothetical protein